MHCAYLLLLSYIAKEPTADSSILPPSQDAPSEPDRVHVRPENTHFCKQHSRWIHLNWAECITDCFYVAQCPVRCHIKMGWLLLNILPQINNQPERKKAAQTSELLGLGSPYSSVANLLCGSWKATDSPNHYFII